MLIRAWDRSVSHNSHTSAAGGKLLPSVILDRQEQERSSHGLLGSGTYGWRKQHLQGPEAFKPAARDAQALDTVHVGTKSVTSAFKQHSSAGSAAGTEAGYSNSKAAGLHLRDRQLRISAAAERDRRFKQESRVPALEYCRRLAIAVGLTV